MTWLWSQTTFVLGQQIQFAAELEKKLLEVWRSAAIFKEPVAASSAQGYYERIKNPICLLDIRNKIGWSLLIPTPMFLCAMLLWLPPLPHSSCSPSPAKFEYTSVREVLDDFDLMAANAETYNGKNHPIAKQAGKVRDTMVFLLMHKFNTLGRDLDELSQLEIAIKKRLLVAWGKCRCLS